MYLNRVVSYPQSICARASSSYVGFAETSMLVCWTSTWLIELFVLLGFLQYEVTPFLTKRVWPFSGISQWTTRNLNPWGQIALVSPHARHFTKNL